MGLPDAANLPAAKQSVQATTMQLGCAVNKAQVKRLRYVDGRVRAVTLQAFRVEDATGEGGRRCAVPIDGVRIGVVCVELKPIRKSPIEREFSGLIVGGPVRIDDQHLTKVRIQPGAVVRIAHAKELTVVGVGRYRLMVGFCADISRLG